jgi:hypothetical protein
MCCIQHFDNNDMNMRVSNDKSNIIKIRKIMNDFDKYNSKILEQQNNKLLFGKYSHCTYSFVYNRLKDYTNYLKEIIHNPTNKNVKSFYKYIELRDNYDKALNYHGNGL